jgi:hypothetical protein
MAKVNLTAGRIAAFQCEVGKAQAFLWCAEVPGLAVRATTGSTRKRYVFQSKVSGQSMRVTIGDVKIWSIEDAKAEARRLQVLIDQGNDPRKVKADADAAKIADDVAQASKQLSESVTVAEAWKAYIADRSASIKNGKPEWGEKHRAPTTISFK